MEDREFALIFLRLVNRLFLDNCVGTGSTRAKKPTGPPSTSRSVFAQTTQNANVGRAMTQCVPADANNCSDFIIS